MRAVVAAAAASLLLLTPAPSHAQPPGSAHGGAKWVPEGVATRAPTSAIEGAPTPEAQAKTSQPPKPAPRRALLIGSSSFAQSFGRVIEEDLKARGYETVRKGLVSAGFARPDYKDVPKIIREQPIDEHTHAVVLYFGMNDAQSIRLRPSDLVQTKRKWLYWRDERWGGVYVRRTRALLNSLCERGVRNVIVLLPVDVARNRLQTRLARVRSSLSQAAGGAPCATAFSTSGDRGRFRLKTSRRLRLSDGVHMTRRGAKTVWKRIRDRVLHLIDGNANDDHRPDETRSRALRSGGSGVAVPTDRP